MYCFLSVHYISYLVEELPKIEDKIFFQGLVQKLVTGSVISENLNQETIF